jgi:F0F1-type ATP synthase membrane subunit a
MSPHDMSACLTISLHAYSIRKTGYHRFLPELIPIPKSTDVFKNIILINAIGILSKVTKSNSRNRDELLKL